MKKTINAILVDDEPLAIKNLKVYLTNNYPEIDIVGSFHSIDDAVEGIILLKPDLLFLDIELPTGSGFEIVEKTKNLKHKIIFTTAYNEHAIKAFKVNAIDYLLKPIDEDDFRMAVNKALNYSTNDQEELKQIIGKLDENKVIIPIRDGFEFVEKKSIIRLQSESNYTRIYFANKEKLLISKTLKDIEKLIDSDDFIRVHHSHLINKIHISRYLKTDGGLLVMSDNSIIPISKSKKMEVIQKTLQ